MGDRGPVSVVPPGPKLALNGPDQKHYRQLKTQIIASDITFTSGMKSKQELSCCSDGRAMWHKSNNAEMRVGQFSGKMRRERVRFGGSHIAKN